MIRIQQAKLGFDPMYGVLVSVVVAKIGRVLARVASVFDGNTLIV
jgi:hypothetical protein